MNPGKTFYTAERQVWRAWLKEHHKTEKEIWLVYYRKDSGKPRIPYNDAVEEALCFGWIDSTLAKVDHESFAQRFTPRRKNSQLSEMNKERIRRLLKQKKMTRAGLAAVDHAFDKSPGKPKFSIPSDILKALKRDKTTWNNFQQFPDSYKRIRIGWIDGSRNRPDFFKQRLNYFLKMTKANKRFGMVQ